MCFFWIFRTVIVTCVHVKHRKSLKLKSVTRFYWYFFWLHWWNFLCFYSDLLNFLLNFTEATVVSHLWNGDSEHSSRLGHLTILPNLHLKDNMLHNYFKGYGMIFACTLRCKYLFIRWLDPYKWSSLVCKFFSIFSCYISPPFF